MVGRLTVLVQDCNKVTVSRLSALGKFGWIMILVETTKVVVLVDIMLASSPIRVSVTVS